MDWWIEALLCDGFFRVEDLVVNGHLDFENCSAAFHEAKEYTIGLTVQAFPLPFRGIMMLGEYSSCCSVAQRLTMSTSNTSVSQDSATYTNLTFG
jgi:hypothetical protein